MDSLIQIVRGKQPAFYAAYMNHRRVIETGNSPLVLKALVTDAATHSGIRGVKATFAPLNGTAKLATDKTNKPMVKTTAAKGMFRVKNMPAGSYMVTVAKAGYREQTIPVTIIDYELAEMKVELERD